MDVVADARLTAAVSAAGGLGILGGGYGDEQWLGRELDVLTSCRARFGVGFNMLRHATMGTLTLRL